jgi:hypothetical protein
MKKLAYLSLAFFLFTFVASAQKVKEADLQGTWKLIEFESSGLSLDVIKGTVTASKELEAQLPADQLSAGKADMLSALEAVKDLTMTFDKTSMTQKMGGQEKTGNFVLKEKEGKQYLDVATADTTEASQFFVTLKDKKLRLSQVGAGGQSLNMTFTK